ncbi:MAG: hypothetical protein KGJ18_02345 [Gammaproteobacteria bacterium]|nr:hypothetical protein [Gammaproteobacteria bacterium]
MGKLNLKSGLAVIAMLLLAHTGYGNSNPAGAPPTRLSGIYSGTATYYRYPGPVASTPNRMIGAVRPDGNGYFISVPAASSDIRLFQNLRGSGQVISPERDVPTEGQGVARGAQNWQFEVKPADSSGNAYALQGTFNCGDCYIALNLQMQPLTHQHLSLDSRGGRYQGFDINRMTKVVITLDSEGHFTGTDAMGCRISGTLTQVGKLNLFDTRVTIAGSSVCHGAMTGVAFFDTRDRTGQFSGATGSYLYLLGANSDFSHGFAMAVSYRRK